MPEKRKKKEKGFNEMMDLWGGLLLEPVWIEEGGRNGGEHLIPLPKNLPQSYKTGGFSYIFQ